MTDMTDDERLDRMVAEEERDFLEGDSSGTQNEEGTSDDS